jgi:SWI/SNF-related matrix-associated actin-dependent regulator of chromatin subfamily A3
LDAERRWCVSGTPLQNGLNDIATLFKFLRYEPLHTKAGFHRYVLLAQTDGKTGIDNLRSALRAICLRRTKEAIRDKLPPREEVIKTLRLRSDERALYDLHVQNMCIRGALNKSNMAETLQCLLKLRLICNHGEDLLSRGFIRNPDLKLNCTVCRVQLVEEDVQVEGRACPHRKLCAGCFELTQCSRGYGAQDLECEACVNVCSTPEPMLSSTFSNYKGPSTKVEALLDSIREDYDGTSNSPKQ